MHHQYLHRRWIDHGPAGRGDVAAQRRCGSVGGHQWRFRVCLTADPRQLLRRDGACAACESGLHSRGWHRGCRGARDPSESALQHRLIASTSCSPPSTGSPHAGWPGDCLWDEGTGLFVDLDARRNPLHGVRRPGRRGPAGTRANRVDRGHRADLRSSGAAAPTGECDVHRASLQRGRVQCPIDLHGGRHGACHWLRQGIDYHRRRPVWQPRGLVQQRHHPGRGGVWRGWQHGGGIRIHEERRHVVAAGAHCGPQRRGQRLFWQCRGLVGRRQHAGHWRGWRERRPEGHVLDDAYHQ
ncbi:hypothetical protein D3C71_1349830 [compost metagenome]